MSTSSPPPMPPPPGGSVSYDTEKLDEPRRPSLAEALRSLAPASSPAPANDPTPVTALPVERTPPVLSGWTRLVGPRLSHVVLNLTARLAEFTTKPGKKFEAAEIEEETRDLCDQSMSEALEAWFPLAALTPGRQLLLAFGMAAGEQWLGRREVERAPPAADAASTTGPTITPRPSAPAVTISPPQQPLNGSTRDSGGTLGDVA